MSTYYNERDIMVRKMRKIPNEGGTMFLEDCNDTSVCLLRKYVSCFTYTFK